MNKQSLLEAVSLLYGDDANSFEWINEGLQNRILRCIHRSEVVYIRFMKSERRTLEMVEAELDWLIQLNAADILVPVPKRSFNGHYIEVLESDCGILYVVGFSEVRGNSIEVTNPTVWNNQLFYQWGNTLGKIHGTSPDKKISRPTILDPNSAFSDTVYFLEKYGDIAIINHLKEVVKELQNLSKTESYGLIHNDFHQGNLLIHDNTLGIIDFDDCVYGWYAQDIAVTLYHAYWQGTEIADYDTSFGVTFLESFLQGYTENQRISPAIIEQIPLFLSWRQFFLLALFLKNWPLQQEEWQVHTLESLRNRIITGKDYIPFTSKDIQELIRTFATE